MEIPFISENDIVDRSKADEFTKGLAVMQSGWLVIQSIARTIQGLRRFLIMSATGLSADRLIALSELELATMGFVGCAIVMYFLWWNKPFDVQHATIINCPPQHHDAVYQRLKEMFETRYTSKFLSPTWESFIQQQRMPNWAYLDDLGLGQYFSDYPVSKAY
jgi:hypothetical protein